MTKDDVFTELQKIIIEVLPFINPSDITINKQLVDLGANSIDRSEIVINIMEKLNIRIPANELATIKNIENLVDTLYTAIR